MRRAYKFRLWTNANQERELGIDAGDASPALQRLPGRAQGPLRGREGDGEIRRRNRPGSRPSGRRTPSMPGSTSRPRRPRCDGWTRRSRHFFRRVKAKAGKAGYPRFRGRDRYDSIEFPAHGDGIRLTGDRLRVQHVGMIRVKLHREIAGQGQDRHAQAGGRASGTSSCRATSETCRSSRAPIPRSASTWGWRSSSASRTGRLPSPTPAT